MILVFIETREGKIKKASLETLSEANRIAKGLSKEVGAALIGPGLEALSGETFSYGASKVFLLENQALAQYSPRDFASALFSLAEEVKPAAILFSATSMGKDLAPRLAAKLGVSLASECTKISVAHGKIEFTRPIFAGKAFLSFFLSSSPQMATLRPKVFPLAGPSRQAGETVKKHIDLPEDTARSRVMEYVKEQGGDIDVTEADVVVSGGRGMKGSENFALLQEIATLIPHSAVGASRSAVDSGWINHQHQVGQTGKTVSPSLYMAFGISGAIQHLAGISSSKVIVAVNKDPDAPIFKVADFGIVGDLFQVIPPLKEELKKILSE